MKMVGSTRERNAGLPKNTMESTGKIAYKKTFVLIIFCRHGGSEIHLVKVGKEQLDSEVIRRTAGNLCGRPRAFMRRAGDWRTNGHAGAEAGGY
jgi:hypothetical protein